MSGIFMRVLQAGDICVGDVLHRVSCPWPQWTLSRLADAMYRDCPCKGMDAYTTLKYWRGSLEELAELANMSELAEFEWGRVAKTHQKQFDERQGKGKTLDVERHMASSCTCNGARKHKRLATALTDFLVPAAKKAKQFFC